MSETTGTTSRWDPDGEEARSLRLRAERLWNRDYVERVLVPCLEIPIGGRAVDVGTGFGALAFLLASVRPDLEIIGIDPEAGLVEGATVVAANLGLDRVSFRTADGTALPFPDGALDLAMCQTVLTHVADAGAVVREMARVLRPGGTFLAIEWTDRALLSISFDNASPVEPEQAIETYRLTKMYSLGRARLGRGDDEAGIRCPIVAHEAGLDVVDVRLNDRISFAIPPYRSPVEAGVIEEMREWLRSEGPDPGTKAWMAENIRAGGGTDQDVARYFDLTDGPAVRAVTAAALDAGTLAAVIPTAMVVTIARRPG
jgi:ubiquinone/menaquinone biosynthesis C-methylase UbiE